MDKLEHEYDSWYEIFGAFYIETGGVEIGVCCGTEDRILWYSSTERSGSSWSWSWRSRKLYNNTHQKAVLSTRAFGMFFNWKAIFLRMIPSVVSTEAAW